MLQEEFKKVYDEYNPIFAPMISKMIQDNYKYFQISETIRWGFGYDNDLAIKKIAEEPREEKSSIEIKETKTIVEETKEALKETTAYTDDNHVDYNVPVREVIEEEVPKEKKFVAEEHVQAYSDDFFDIPIKRNPVEEEVKKEPVVEKETIIKETITQIPRNNEPYQRNILREVYPSQTSPIGVARTTKVETEEVTGARELNEALTMNNVISENNINVEMPKREIPREETVIREFKENL